MHLLKKSFRGGEIKRRECHHSNHLPHKDHVGRFTRLHKLEIYTLTQTPTCCRHSPRTPQRGKQMIFKIIRESSEASISRGVKTVTLGFLERLVLDEVLEKEIIVNVPPSTEGWNKRRKELKTAEGSPWLHSHRNGSHCLRRGHKRTASPWSCSFSLPVSLVHSNPL